MGRASSEGSQKLVEYLKANGANGKTNQQLADMFGVTTATVSNKKKFAGLVKERSSNAKSKKQDDGDVDATALKEAVDMAGGIDRLIAILEAGQKAGSITAIKNGLEKAKLLASIYLDSKPEETKKTTAKK